jgi:hypothetical protein
MIFAMSSPESKPLQNPDVVAAMMDPAVQNVRKLKYPDVVAAIPPRICLALPFTENILNIPPNVADSINQSHY